MTRIRPSIQTIYDRIKADMESRVTGGVPVPKVSLLGVLNAVFTGGVHLQWGFLEWIKNQIFVDLAASFGRNRWANIFDIPRQSATYATGYFKFTGTASHTVDEGTRVVNRNGYEYETLDDFIIGTDDYVQAQALEAGEAYNAEDSENGLGDVSEYMTLSSADPDIDSDVEVLPDPVDDTASFQNATDLWSIETWVLAMLQRFQNPPACGTRGDYVRWALSVGGVDRAWCLPAEIYSQGSVAVYVASIDADDRVLESVSSAVLTNVEDYIESVRPVPALVDYYTITNVSIRMKISITPYNNDMRDALEDALKELFLLETGPGATILISHIRSAIAAIGLDDYEITDIEKYVSGSGWVSLGVANIESDYPDTPKFINAICQELT